MTQKIKKYFSYEANISKFIFSLVIVAVFGLVFGQSVYAEFIRTTGDSTDYDYGYGYGASGYGYGYGYGAGGDTDYGFEGTDGSATLGTPVPARTSYTVTASTDYLAQVSLNSDAYETTFASGSRTLSATGLTCATAYSITVNTRDADSNVYSTTTAVTTSACASSGGSSRNHRATPAVPAVPGVSPAIPAIPWHRFVNNLTVGSSGVDVIELQKILVAGGYLIMPTGVPMGYFGQLTRTAVKMYQLKNGLPQPGVVGPLTRNILNLNSSKNSNNMSIKELVQLLIQIGFISADKADIARRAVGL